MQPPVLDRRAALKARHRAAILAAASALVEERGGPGFGVDELAARADVARRTVFNHFASHDDVLLTFCTDALTVVVDDVLASVASTPMGDGSRSAMLDELAAALFASDLPTAIAAVVRITGSGEVDERTRPLADLAFARVGERLLQEVARRHPAADALDAALLVGSLMNGVSVIALHWIARTGAALDPASRAEWEQLLTRLLHSLRSGYMPT